LVEELLGANQRKIRYWTTVCSAIATWAVIAGD